MHPRELLDLFTEPYPLLRLRAGSDRLPSGLAAAMVPAVVDWQRSPLNDEADDHFLVRNVNVGGNPVDGRQVLATVKVPRRGVTGAEWVLVHARLLGKEGPAGHGQLRLKFDSDSRPRVLNREGGPMWPDPCLDDLVFSFEAWRSPGSSFQPLAGLDPSTYALTLRCYAGGQRFLEDGVNNRGWIVYPLDFAERKGALDELLYTALVTGDSLARHTICHLLNQPDVHLKLEQSDYPGIDDSQIDKLRPLLDRDHIPEDPIAGLTGGEISYHLLQRSCITMGLTIVDNCLHRVHHQHPEYGEYESLRVAPKRIPGWLSELAHADRRGTLLRLPGAMHWLAVNQTVLPDKSYQVLERAGLLQRRPDGQLERRSYALGGDTPYGRLSDNLMQ